MDFFPTQCCETSVLNCIVQILLIISHLLWVSSLAWGILSAIWYADSTRSFVEKGKKTLQNLFGLLAVAIDLQQDIQSLVQVNTQLALIIPSNPLWVYCKSHCGLWKYYFHVGLTGWKFWLAIILNLFFVSPGFCVLSHLCSTQLCAFNWSKSDVW